MMRSRNWAELSGAALLAASLLGCPGDKDEVPAAKAAAVRPTPSPFPDTPAGKAVAEHLQVVFATGPDAAARYEASLAALRASGDEAVAVIVDGYRKSAPSDYLARTLLVETLSELTLPAALPPLIEIAQTPVPDPRPVPEHALSPYIQEVKIRMVAIRGLGLLAREQPQAEAVLLKLLDHPALAVREEAARALASLIHGLQDRDRAARLRERIPPELRFAPQPERGPVPPPGADPRLRPRSGAGGGR